MTVQALALSSVMVFAAVLQNGPAGGSRQDSTVVRLTYLANEGVMAELPSGRVFFDALFGSGLDGYYVVPPNVRDSLESAAGRFGGRAVLLFTHSHPDHFNANSTIRYLNANAQSTAIMPSDARSAATAGGAPRERTIVAGAPVDGHRDHDLGWARVRALGMTHGGPRPEHAAYVVDVDGWSMLHIGDTGSEPQTWQAMGFPADGVDVALVPYWYMMDEALASQLVTHAKPKHIVVLHGPTPDAEDPGLRGLGGWAGFERRIMAAHRNAHVPGPDGETIVIRR